MKRRLLSAFLAVMMVLTMAPVAFAADEETADSTSGSTGADIVDSGSASGGSASGETATGVAKINNTYYATLAEAVSAAAADGATITLQENVNEDVTITEGKTITLDLNGKTLTVPTDCGILVKGKLTVTGNGRVTCNKTPFVVDAGELVIENGEVNSDSDYGIYAKNGGQITVNGGTLTSSYAVLSGNNTTGDMNFTVNGGILTSKLSEAIYMSGQQTLLINGGVINGGISARMGQITVNGGVINGMTASQNADAMKDYYNHSGSAWIGDAIYVWGGTYTSNNANGNKTNLAINGGTINGNAHRAIAIYDIGTNYEQEISVNISKANVSGDVVLDNTYGNHAHNVTTNISISGGAFTDIANAVKYAADKATIKLAGDVKEDVTIPAGKTITLDLNGKTLTNVNDHTILNNGNLTITDSEGTGAVKNSSSEKQTVYNEVGAIATLSGGLFEKVDSHGYVVLNHGTMTANDGISMKMWSESHSSMFENGWQDGNKNSTRVESKLTINGGVYDGGLNTIKNDDYGNIEIKGGTFKNYTQACFLNWNIAKVSGGTFQGGNNNFAVVLNGHINDTMDRGSLTIEGGTFKGKYAVERMQNGSSSIGSVAINGGNFDTTDTVVNETVPMGTGTIAISGGYFTSDPSTYVADNHYVDGSNNGDYPYIVKEGTKTEAPVIVKDATTVTVPENSEAIKGLTDNDKTNITNKSNVDGVAEAIADNKAALIPTDVNTTGAKKVEIEATVEVNVTGADMTSENKTLTFEASPVATVTVTNADGTTEVKNNVKVPNSLLNGKPITVRLPLPANFNPEQIKHISSDGSEYFLKTAKRGAKLFTVDSDNCAVFEITHFSTFELSGTVTYVEPSSGSSSGGSSSGKTTYKVTTSAVNNGGVNASPSNAEKGATITITLSPDKGYKLDKLTVTDGSGKTVSTVKKSDTVYTFTMPASAVKVGVSYVKATETPSETKFNDVSANDWFASAVDYVTGKGMMNGTADNTFSPKANTTRGMVVTVLYRLENQPSTSAASFTDVASGAYYANAVAWANANGIVSGYGSGKFGPNDKVTREQLAAILYRYAQYKKYDVSVGEDTNILSYDDAQSISSYAIPAIQWACGAGVVTGKSGSKLDPKGNATRAEVAAMLMRFCENVK